MSAKVSGKYQRSFSVTKECVINKLFMKWCDVITIPKKVEIVLNISNNSEFIREAAVTMSSGSVNPCKDKQL